MRATLGPNRYLGGARWAMKLPIVPALDDPTAPIRRTTRRNNRATPAPADAATGLSTHSAAASWELALRLRTRREQLGVDVQTITTELGFSRNYWSAVENERRTLTVDKLKAVLDLLECDEEEERELLELRAATKQRGWRTRYSAVCPAQALRYYGLEHGAKAIRTYASVLVLGLLQAEPYIRAMMTSEFSTIRQVEVDQLMELRLHRQQRLTGDDPPRLIAIVSEVALVQQIGGPGVLRDQLRHLAQVVEECPHVDLLVIPFTATWCGIFGASSFHLLDFDSPRLPTLAWHESVTIGNVIDDEHQVRDLSLTYTDAFKRTLSREDSLQLIHRRLHELT
jgi:transcriptional regulator with XRE-family HTH domain